MTIDTDDITSPIASDLVMYFVGNNGTIWDEMRIATTWDEAAPLIPEPSTLLMLALAALTVFLWRLKW